MYRGVVHFHSNLSYDSISNISAIVKMAEKCKLNFLILTDHDDITGSILLKDYVEAHGIKIDVPLAAEYKTSFGDVIALGIYKQIVNREFYSFVDEVRKQNGYLLFPHPYEGHIEIESIAERVDLIEVFNSRVSDNKNLQAKKLADHFKKPFYFSPDAHSCRALRYSIVEVARNGGVINSIITNKISQVTSVKTKRCEIWWSQVLKSVKTKNLRSLAMNFYCIKHGFDFRRI